MDECMNETEEELKTLILGDIKDYQLSEYVLPYDMPLFLAEGEVVFKFVTVVDEDGDESVCTTNTS